METGYLGLQAAVNNMRLQVRKVAGKENPADLFAKHLAAAEMWKHLGVLGMADEDGRTKAIPNILTTAMAGQHLHRACYCGFGRACLTVGPKYWLQGLLRGILCPVGMFCYSWDQVI